MSYPIGKSSEKMGCEYFDYETIIYKFKTNEANPNLKGSTDFLRVIDCNFGNGPTGP
jgi:hypothetical protein